MISEGKGANREAGLASAKPLTKNYPICAQ